MYLYFTKEGVLKEIINDDNIVVGNSEINKLYVYVEGLTLNSVWYRFAMPGRDPEYYPALTGAELVSNTVVNTKIPFCKERDLKFFNYSDTFRFVVITIPASSEQEDIPVLSSDGVVLCSIKWSVTSGYQVGNVTFNVTDSAEGIPGHLEYDGYVSLSQFNYLLEKIDEYRADKLNAYITLSSLETLKNLRETYGDAFQFKIIVGSGYITYFCLVRKLNNSNYYEYYFFNGTKTYQAISILNSDNTTTLGDALSYTNAKTMFVQKDSTLQLGSDGTITYDAETGISIDANGGDIYLNGDIVHAHYLHINDSEGKGRVIFGNGGTIMEDPSNEYGDIEIITGEHFGYIFNDVGVYVHSTTAGNKLLTKDEVDSIVATIKANAYQVVASLPVTGQEGIIYLVETSAGSGVYNQYIWEGSDYISLGTTQIDLSGYVQKTQTIAGIALSGNISAQDLYAGLFDITEVTVDED